MISIEQTDGTLPDNLPLLTQVVGDDALDDLPTLTEVIAPPDTQVRISSSPLHELRTSRLPSRDEEPGKAVDGARTLAVQAIDTADIAPVFQPDGIPVVTPLPVESPDDHASSDLALPEVATPAEAVTPVLPAPEQETGDLATQPTVSPAAAMPRTLTETELQQVLSHVEAHLTTVFTEKLTRHLEHLQHQAVEHAINELKAELPELLHGALDTHRNTL